MSHPNSPDVDILSVYAYADRSYLKDREMWRGFLRFLLPLLLETEARTIEALVDSAIVRSPEELLDENDGPVTIEQFIRVVSCELAAALDLPPELGLAAFLECALPTRVHSVGGGAHKVKGQDLVTSWLNRFSLAQDEPEFEVLVAEWRQLFEEVKSMLKPPQGDLGRPRNEEEVDDSDVQEASPSQKRGKLVESA